MKLIIFSISRILIFIGGIIKISCLEIECSSLILPERFIHRLGETGTFFLGADNLKLQLSFDPDQLKKLLTTKGELQLFHPKIRAIIDITQRGGVGFGLLFELARKITSEHLFCDYTMHAYSINPDEFHSRLFSVNLKNKKEYCMKFYDDIIVKEVSSCLMHHLNSLQIPEIYEFEEPEVNAVWRTETQ